MANRSKISIMYWEANCLPPTIILPSQKSDKPSSSSQTVSLTADALDQIKKEIKELMDLDKAPPDQEHTQQFASPGFKEPLMYPKYWKLRYSNEVEAQMQSPTPENLPGRYRHPRRRSESDSQTSAPHNAASCTYNAAEPSPPESNPKKQPSKHLQGSSIASRVHVKLRGPNTCDRVLYPHYESDALLRQTGDQLDSVDQAHDKLKKSYVDFERTIRSAKDKEN